jgi:RNA polymerase sigma-70 factor (ECF subfamily)
MAGDVAHIALVPRKFGAERRTDATDELFATLAARAADGDLGAFDELMVLTERRVVSIAWRMLGDADAARDAAQEVYLRVFRSLGGYRPAEPFMAWVYRITVNVCHDAVRRRRRYELRHEPLLDDEGAGPASCDDVEGRVLDAQKRELVARALETLPERERAAFVLRDLEGLTTDEAASALGTRPVTVRSQVSIARAKIKAYCARALDRGRKE